MLIYLRHGDDHSDASEHRHDRHLSKRGLRSAPKLAKKLIKKYGHPDAVYVSPFVRTRETIEAMSERFTRPVDIHQDSRLAPLFSKKQQRDPSVSPETALAVPILESRVEFHARVHAHVADMRSAGHHRSGTVVWVVTHKVVVKTVGKRHFDVKTPKNPDFLDYVVVRG